MKVHLVAVHVRWMVKSDTEQVLAIGDHYPYPWDAEALHETLSCSNCIGQVAEEKGGKIVGFVVYDLERTFIEILNLAVHPAYKGRGVGTQIMQKVKEKLRTRRSLRLTVPESALGLQLFLKNERFLATKVRRDYFDVEDGFRFIYREGV